MNIASIDIGSNTVLLLIASIIKETGSFESIVNKYEIPRLGRGLKTGSNIPPENITRFVEVMSKYVAIIKNYNCETILLNATNALRVASNSKEIVQLIYDKFDLNIDVIAGEKEAHLSFLGASSSLPNFDKKIVIDVGGGSTEIILGDENNIEFRQSFVVGAVSLTEACVENDPPTVDEITGMRENVREIFTELDSEMFYNIPIIAVAGTPTTLSCMKQSLKLYDENLVEGAVLSSEDFSQLISSLSKSTANEIKVNYGKIVEGREDVLLAGTIILDELMQMMKQNQFYVSGRGLRYGAVIDYLKNNPVL